MKIIIEHHSGQYPSFNVSLASDAGLDPFISIKGARIVDGRNGPFVSWPSRKKDDGSYWNHVWGSDAFNAAVLKEAQRTQPATDTRTHGESRRPPPRSEAPPF